MILNVLFIILLFTYNLQTAETQPVIEITIQCDNPCTHIEDAYGLTNIDDIGLFIRYVKTQSEQIETEIGKRDVYFVMQTMLNRLRHKECTWREYYNSQSLNNSMSILKMKKGILNPSFNQKNHRDQILMDMLRQCIMHYDGLDGSLTDTIPRNVLFFESFKRIPNRGPHTSDKYYGKARHKFYVL